MELEAVKRLEAELMALPQADCPTRHHFAGGIYGREMFMRAGTTLTGATHKRQHMALFVGDVSVFDGESVKRLTGHNMMVTEAGTKRAMYAHADSYVTGYFITDKTDIQDIERDLVEEGPAMLQSNRTQEVIECS
jgi:hypothetical protein